MAKAKTTKAAKKTTKATQKETFKATALLRKGALAYVGLHGAAYERAKFRFEQVRGATDGNKFAAQQTVFSTHLLQRAKS